MERALVMEETLPIPDANRAAEHTERPPAVAHVRIDPSIFKRRILADQHLNVKADAVISENDTCFESAATHYDASHTHPDEQRGSRGRDIVINEVSIQLVHAAHATPPVGHNDPRPAKNGTICVARRVPMSS